MPVFRELTRSKSLKLGTYIGEFATPGIGKILGAAGCDFAFVDMEHSGFSFETARSAIGHLHDSGVATVLRPPSQASHHLARACDIGAQGIIPPMLSTAEQARNCVSSINYPPKGSRGCALGIAHDDFRQAPVFDALRLANGKTSFVALIETEEGVQNSDEIASVEGVDCLWIGHLDLSLSLGIPGQFENQRFLDAVGVVMDSATRHGKSIGRLVGSTDEGERLFRDGCDFICYLGDVWLFQRALREAFEEIRSRSSDKG